jgi:di- and tripeptidase
MHTFQCNHGAVLSLAGRRETIYAGCQDGYVKVWDLETRTLVRTLIVQESVDVLSLSVMHSDFYACCADGQVQVSVFSLGLPLVFIQGSSVGRHPLTAQPLG